MIVQLWVFFSLACFVFALLGRRNAKAELKKLGEVLNGRRRLGRGHIRDETIVAVIAFIWLAIGVWYWKEGVQVSNPVVALPLLGTNGLLAFSTAARWLDRRYIQTSRQTGESALQHQDRLVGDERRRLQAEDVLDTKAEKL